MPAKFEVKDCVYITGELASMYEGYLWIIDAIYGTFYTISHPELGEIMVHQDEIIHGNIFKAAIFKAK